MARKLSQMTWDDVQEEMSIAGSPEKLRKVGEEVLALVVGNMNTKSIPELINMQFALQRVTAELRLYEKMERKRQSI